MNESSLAVVSVFLGLSLVSLQFLHWSVAGLSFRDQFLNLFLRAPELKGNEPKGRKPGGSSRVCVRVTRSLQGIFQLVISLRTQEMIKKKKKR